MTPEALTALQASIEHWKRLADSVPSEDAAEQPYSGDCPLCQAFASEPVEGCNNCPIRLKTGRHACMGTPYWRAEGAWVGYRRGNTALSDWQAAARAELEFLQSLLPTEQGE